MEAYPFATIETALNGKLALDKVLEEDLGGKPFELIFMDINMPEMDGLESSRLIVQSFNEGRLRSKPYIAAITAYESPETKRQALNAGMEKFLTKPAMAARVYDVCKHVLNNVVHRKLVTSSRSN